MSASMCHSYTKPLKLLAGTAAAALLIGWAVGAGAQTTDPSPPQQQASSLPANSTAAPVPLGVNDVREVQNQLIALGYNPGPADGQIGPATITSVQQYDHSHGGTGQAQIDSALLARLKADTGPRLSYEQVAERAQAQTSAAPASGASQFGGIVQQIVPLIGAAIANSNNNNNNGYYGPGPGYYGPPPGYYGYGYGGY